MKATENIQYFVVRQIKEQFKTAYDYAKTFGEDYQNVCKWFKDYKKIPLKKALEMADYFNMRVVVFREKE